MITRLTRIEGILEIDHENGFVFFTAKDELAPELVVRNLPIVVPKHQTLDICADHSAWRVNWGN